MQVQRATQEADRFGMTASVSGSFRSGDRHPVRLADVPGGEVVVSDLHQALDVRAPRELILEIPGEVFVPPATLIGGQMVLEYFGLQWVMKPIRSCRVEVEHGEVQGCMEEWGQVACREFADDELAQLRGGHPSTGNGQHRGEFSCLGRQPVPIGEEGRGEVVRVVMRQGSRGGVKSQDE